MTIPKTIMVCLLLSWVFLAVACRESPTQEITGGGGDFTQGSFGYRFDSDQQVDRGRDDDLTMPSRTNLGEEVPPSDRGRSDFLSQATPPSQTPAAPSDDRLGLQSPSEEGDPEVTPLPYPEEWLSPPPQRGFFESEAQVLLMLALVVIGAIALIGVLRKW